MLCLLICCKQQWIMQLLQGFVATKRSLFLWFSRSRTSRGAGIPGNPDFKSWEFNQFLPINCNEILKFRCHTITTMYEYGWFWLALIKRVCQSKYCLLYHKSFFQKWNKCLQLLCIKMWNIISYFKSKNRAWLNWLVQWSATTGPQTGSGP